MLTDHEALGAPQEQRRYHLEDGNGLFLQIPPVGLGSKSWVLRYTLVGNRSMVGLGPLTEVDVALARTRAAAARVMIAAGQKPTAVLVAEAATKVQQQQAARVTRSDAARTVGMCTLKDIQCRAARGQDQPYRLSDGGGLYLVVQSDTAKSWTYRYVLKGVSGSIGLGSYPLVSLMQARALRDAARGELAAGRRPTGARANTTADPVSAGEWTVETLIEAWLAFETYRWKESFRREVERRLRQSVNAKIGDMPVREVTSAVLLEKVLEPAKTRSHDLARRLRQHLEDAFAYGIDKGKATSNPALMRKKALGKAPASGHWPALVDLDKARALLRRVEQWNELTLTGAGQPQVKLANRFLALTAVRPGEVRYAEWREVEGLDGDAPVWRIPGARMKGGDEHLVPLSAQAVDVLHEARRHSGRSDLIFPAVNGGSKKPLSENTINAFLAVKEHCSHGWRSTFSTNMNDRHPGNGDVIEAALAHEMKNKVRAAYNRGDYFVCRRVLMQEWADLLLAGMADATAICLGPRRAPSVAPAARRIAA